MLRVSGTTIALVWSTFVDLPSSRPKERIEPISIGRSLVLRESLRVFRFSFSTRVHRTNVRRVFQLPVPHTHTQIYTHTHTQALDQIDENDCTDPNRTTLWLTVRCREWFSYTASESSTVSCASNLAFRWRPATVLTGHTGHKTVPTSSGISMLWEIS